MRWLSVLTPVQESPATRFTYSIHPLPQRTRKEICCPTFPEKVQNTREDPLCLPSPYPTAPSPSLYHIPGPKHAFFPIQILLLGVILRVKEKPFIALQLMLAFLPIHSTGHPYFCPNWCVSHKGGTVWGWISHGFPEENLPRHMMVATARWTRLHPMHSLHHRGPRLWGGSPWN